VQVSDGLREEKKHPVALAADGDHAEDTGLAEVLAIGRDERLCCYGVSTLRPSGAARSKNVPLIPESPVESRT